MSDDWFNDTFSSSYSPQKEEDNDWFSNTFKPPQQGWLDSAGSFLKASGEKALGGLEKAASGFVQRAADQKAALNEYSDNPFIQMGAEAYQQFKPLWAPDLINENAHGTSETADYLKNQARLNQQSATENLVGNRIPGADIGSTIIGGIPMMAAASALAGPTMGASFPLLFGAQAYGEDYAQGRESGLTPEQSNTRAMAGGLGAGVLAALPGAGTLVRNVLTGAAQSVGETLGRGGYDVIKSPNTYSPTDWLKELGENALIGGATGGAFHGLSALTRSIKERISPTIAETIPEPVQTGNPDFDSGQFAASEIATQFALHEQPLFTKSDFNLKPVPAELPVFRQSEQVGQVPVLGELAPSFESSTPKNWFDTTFPSEPDNVSRKLVGGLNGIPPELSSSFNPKAVEFNKQFNNLTSSGLTKSELRPTTPTRSVADENAPLFDEREELATPEQVNRLNETLRGLKNRSSLRPEPAISPAERISREDVLSDLNNSKLGQTLSKKIQVVNDVSEIPGDHGLSADSQGAYVNGKLYLISDNLKSGSAVPVALHEAVHGVLNSEPGGSKGMEAILQDKFPDIVDKIKSIAESGNKIAYSALDRATKSGVSEADLPHEIVSYFAEEAQQARANGSVLGKAGNILKDMYSGVRVWAHNKLGLPLDLSSNDIHYILRTAAENFSNRKEAINSIKDVAFASRPDGEAPNRSTAEQTALRPVFGNQTIAERLGIRESAIKSVQKEEGQNRLVSLAREHAPFLEDFTRKVTNNLEQVAKAARGLLLSDQGQDLRIVGAKDLGSRVTKAMALDVQAFGNRVRQVTQKSPITEADLAAFEKGGVNAVKPEHKQIFQDYYNLNKANSINILDELTKAGNPITKGLVETAEAIAANAGKYFGRHYLLDKEKNYGENLWHDYTKGKGEAKAKAAAIIEPAKQKLGELYLIPSGDLSRFHAFKLRDLYQTWIGPLSDIRGTIPRKEQMIQALEQMRNNLPKDVNETLNFLTKEYLNLAGKDPTRVAEFFRNVRREEGNLRKREDVPIELRKLAGEIIDPVTKMVESLTTQTHIIGQHKTLNALYDIGLNNGENSFLFKTPGEKPGATVKLAGSSFGPLNGLYTSPLVAEALNAQVRMHMAGSKLLDTIAKGEVAHILPTLFGSTLGKGIEKLAKIFRTTHVLLNPRNWIMQTMGAPLHMLRAGNFGAYKLADAISATKGGIGLGYRTEANEATRNMILGGGSDVAIAGDLKVSSPEYKNGVNTKYNQTGQQELKHKFANASEAFRESFQAGDQLAKESNRLRELDFWKRYYESKGINKSVDDLTNEVAQRIALTETSYSKANLLSKAVDRSGLGYFRAYSQDMARVMKNNYLEAFSDIIKGFQDHEAGDIKSGNMLIKHGTQRLVGSLLSTMATRGLQAAVGYGVYGGTTSVWDRFWNKDIADQKKALPEYMQEGYPIFGGKDANGNTLVYDLAPIDPNDPFNRYVMSFATEPTPENLKKVIGGFLSGVTVEPSNLGMYKTIYDYANHVVSEKPMKSGLESVAPNTSKAIQAGLVNHLGMTPAGANVAISSAEKLLPIKNIAASWENRNSPLTAAQYGFGLMPTKVNPVKDIETFESKKFNQQMGEAKQRLAQYLSVPNVSKDVLASVVKDSIKAQLEYYNDFQEKVKGAKALEYSNSDIRKALREGQVSKREIGSIMSNQFRPNLPFALKNREEFYKNALDKILSNASTPEERTQLRARFRENVKTMNEVFNMFHSYKGSSEDSED